MSLYSLMHGENPLKNVLKHMLELDTPNSFRSGRFRDIYIDETGDRIILHTRNGGGNRDCYCDNSFISVEEKIVEWEGEKHCENCLYVINGKLKTHPNYIEDHDDDSDFTYANFVFSIPEKYKLAVAELFKAQGVYKAPDEKWQNLFIEMRTMTKEQMEEDRRFKPFNELFKEMRNS